MRRALPVFALLILLAATPGLAGEISYELYQRKDGGNVLIAKGTKIYGPEDFSLRREDRDGKFYGVSKVLPLHNGYSVGTLDTQERDVSGFGLWVDHLPFESNPNDFSWEWYKREANGLFTKLQGGSRVKVSFSGLPLMQAIRRVEFLDDVKLDYTDGACCKPKDGGPTHVLLIRAGSVLEFPHDS